MDRVLIAKIASLIIYCFILFGITLHKKRALHRKLMKLSFLFDLLLLFYIEAGRHAIEKAMDLPDGLLGIHIIVAVLTMLIYPIVLYSGSRFYKGEIRRIIHRNLAYTFLLFRTLNLITSFFL